VTAPADPTHLHRRWDRRRPGGARLRVVGADRAGIHGGPSVIAGNLLLFSGAQRTSLIAKALRGSAPAQAAAQAELHGARADARA
jgi:hypothetical protein